MKKIMGLCEGRHEIITNDGEKINEFIFGNNINPIDVEGSISEMCHKALRDVTSLEVYVTGLTVALVSVINYCIINLIPLKLWHYDRESESYYVQDVFSDLYASDLKECGYI